MQVIRYPEKKEWPNFLKRPYTDNAAVLATAQQIVERVRSGGDAALLELSKKFGGVALTALQVSRTERTEAAEAVSPALRTAIQHAKKNIETFHKAQQTAPKKIETEPGVACWQKPVPIAKVGL